MYDISDALDVTERFIEGRADVGCGCCDPACGFHHDQNGNPYHVLTRYPGGLIPINGNLDFNANPFPLPGTKWGEPGFGNPGGVVTWALVGEGQFIDPEGDNSFVFTDSVDPDTVYPFDVEEILRAQFDKWSEVANITFVQVEDDDTPFLDFTNVDAAEIRIAHGPIADPVLGFAYFPTIGELVMNSELEQDLPFVQTDSLEQLYTSVALHEIGHTIGLTHSIDPNAVMAAFNIDAPVELVADDINRAQQLYGAPSDEPMAITLDADQPDFQVVYSRQSFAVTGAREDNLIEGSVGDDILDGAAGFDTLDGGVGNDTLIGGPNADIHRGGEGFDTGVIRAGFDPESLELEGERLRVEGERGAFETFTGTERIHFENGTLAIDLEGSYLGTVTRMYISALGREPDAGVLHWQDQMIAGMSALALAEAFVASAEFAALYDAPDDPGFIDALYWNVLGRGPDGGGEAFWLEAFEAGTSRAQMLVSFTESPEAIDASDELLQSGLFFSGTPELFL